MYSNSLGIMPFQVRGPPASGKSTLANLLYRHIQQMEPDAPIVWLESWSMVQVHAASSGWMDYISNVIGWKYHKAPRNSVIILDDAQQSYWDLSLWNELFKPISGSFEKSFRVIVFAGYGDPCRAGPTETSMVIPQKHRITLRTSHHNDGLPEVGLLFTLEELHEFVDQRFKSHSFDPAFLTMLHSRTAGHIGATEDILRVIQAHDVCFHPRDF